mmetsp:Transcript_5555/g.13531  ORF Transcript_5555/g.13531 Transcript_5555/m.13531 type:complete len:93 (-) Transcript_5555:124-402(-)
MCRHSKDTQNQTYKTMKANLFAKVSQPTQISLRAEPRAESRHITRPEEKACKKLFTQLFGNIVIVIVTHGTCSTGRSHMFYECTGTCKIIVN